MKAAVLSTLGALVLGILVFPPEALAHWSDLSVAEITVEETRAEMILTFPTGLVEWADRDRDGRLSAREVSLASSELHAFFREHVRVRAGDRSAALRVEPIETMNLPVPVRGPQQTHSTLRLVYTWPKGEGSMAIKYGLFVPGVPTASCVATLRQGRQTSTVVFTPEHGDLVVGFGNGSFVGIGRQVASFVALGVEHILTGYDHILFLISLLMVAGGLRYLLKVVTAFTLAHSLTLSLAVLNVVALPARLVESVIALSIVYVALENFWGREHRVRRRWLVTFAFGLVHGLGFASILKEIQIPASTLPISLVSFNLGVEAGQILIVGAAWLGLQAIARLAWEPRLRRVVSAGAAVMGLIWFLQRALPA